MCKTALAALAFAVFVTAAHAQIPNPIEAPFYFNGTPVSVSVVGTTLATTATIPAVASRTAYLCGLSIRSNATTAISGTATVTGTVSGTLTFLQPVSAPSGIGITEPNLGSICIAASAPNTAIVVTPGAAGSGGNVTVSAWGFYAF